MFDRFDIDTLELINSTRYPMCGSEGNACFNVPVFTGLVVNGYVQLYLGSEQLDVVSPVQHKYGWLNYNAGGFVHEASRTLVQVQVMLKYNESFFIDCQKKNQLFKFTGYKS